MAYNSESSNLNKINVCSFTQVGQEKNLLLFYNIIINVKLCC